MFISEAIAATETAAAESPSPMLGLLIQLILVFAIFYFILIRPQQKKMKEHEDMLVAIKPKDEIITAGGIYAKVVKSVGDDLQVEIAKGVEVKISRSTVRDVVSEKQTEVREKK